MIVSTTVLTVAIPSLPAAPACPGTPGLPSVTVGVVPRVTSNVTLPSAPTLAVV